MCRSGDNRGSYGGGGGYHHKVKLSGCARAGAAGAGHSSPRTRQQRSCRLLITESIIRHLPTAQYERQINNPGTADPTFTMLWDGLPEDPLLSDQLMFECSPVDSLINFQLPTLADAADWHLDDLDFNCDSFVTDASDLNEEDTNLGALLDFDFGDLNRSLIDEYLSEALSSDLSNDTPSSGTELGRGGDSSCALQTHDYVQRDREGETKSVKVQSWGEPKFCAEFGAYKCPVASCGKLYAKASHVRAHLRRHSGEKPYRCTWAGCAWRFARSDELARHRRSHSGDKPYLCRECSKRFARSDHLAKHGRVHARRAAAAAARRTSAQHGTRRSARPILLV